ncbi:MAG: tetratricopeptide repeat protein [Oligoflexia bacterium]|nr:tetratricopeptide repeat protein [Oligoflexia bacterium]MBF0365322.1 tetratricopeptide repeat protein [Oligoflexia bacterium]
MKAKLIIVCLGILVLIFVYWGVKRLRGGGDSSSDSELEIEAIDVKKTERSVSGKSGNKEDLLDEKESSLLSVNKKSLGELNSNLESGENQNKSDSPFYKLAVEGVKLLSEGKFELGIEKLNEVLQKDPNNEIALEGLGLYYLEEGKSAEKALPFFQKLVENNPNNPVAINELTFVLEESGGLEKVESYLKEMVEKNPHSANLLTSYAHTLTRQGRLEDAIPHLENAANTSITGGDKESATYAMEDLANLYLETSNMPEAVKNFRRIMGLKQQMLQETRQKNNDRADLINEKEDDLLSTRLDLAHALILDNNCDEAQTVLSEIDARLRNDPGVNALIKESSEKCKGGNWP